MGTAQHCIEIKLQLAIKGLLRSNATTAIRLVQALDCQLQFDLDAMLGSTLHCCASSILHLRALLVPTCRVVWMWRMMTLKLAASVEKSMANHGNRAHWERRTPAQF